MNNDDFNKLVEGRIAKCRETLFRKNKEYSSDTDRLHNFKVAARIGSKEESPERALLGMWRKHLVSVFDLIDAAERGEAVDTDLCDEKITDAINYLHLLEALLVERSKVPRKDQVHVAHGTNAELRYQVGSPAGVAGINNHLGFEKCSCALCTSTQKAEEPTI